jgi:uncharacterized membrane protein
MYKRVLRLLKHRWTSDAAHTLPPPALQRLQKRVAASEQRHSGEVRLYVESGLPNSYLLRPHDLPTLTRQRALTQFGKLRVWDTAHNNGVLIYLLLAEHAIELVADRGIDQYISPRAWDEVVAHLGVALKAGNFEQGLGQAIDAVTAILVQHFPLELGEFKTNALPDQPSLG